MQSSNTYIEKVDPEYIMIYYFITGKAASTVLENACEHYKNAPHFTSLIDAFTYESMLQYYDDFEDNYNVINARLNTMCSIKDIQWAEIGRLAFNDQNSIIKICLHGHRHIHPCAVAASGIVDLTDDFPLGFELKHYAKQVLEISNSGILDYEQLPYLTAEPTAQVIERLTDFCNHDGTPHKPKDRLLFALPSNDTQH